MRLCAAVMFLVFIYEGGGMCEASGHRPSIHMPESLVQVDHARKPHLKKQERGCQEGGWLHCRPQ